MPYSSAVWMFEPFERSQVSLRLMSGKVKAHDATLFLIEPSV